MLRSHTRHLLRNQASPGLRIQIANAQRRYANLAESADLPKAGEQLHGFTIQRHRHFPELQLTALELQHAKTGAQHLHIARNDSNNVFSIGFKTNPPDHTGVPHILEHTTLCGSERYPVRDPFFKMLPRSLSNFMNAFTAADHTSYPFATTNAKDFQNLLAVYLDATLHPLLQEQDFRQEGWRLGPEKQTSMTDAGLQGAKADLVFKGVVYNEMKGQMSDAGYLYYTKYQDHIFPDIKNSGGDPQQMTELTYDNLKRFHREHYHPSNAKIFTYGDMPLDKHLSEIDRQLEAFGKTRTDNTIKEPIKITEPYHVTVAGPVDPLVSSDRQFKTSISWIMGDTSDVVEVFSLGVLSSLLLDGYGSPLYRALIESELGPDFSPNTGFDSAGKTGIFCVGLNGVKAGDVPRVEIAIKETLEEVRKKGFDQNKIEGILHQLEIALKHKGANFGMELMQRVLPGWFNGVDPFDALAWDHTIGEFRKHLENGDYLERLLEKYLLNGRTLTFTMAPKDDFADELTKDEQVRLSRKLEEVAEAAGGMAEATKRIEVEDLKLSDIQEKARNENLDCLPTLHVVDIPRVMKVDNIRESKVDSVTTQWRETNTNGVTYFRAIHLLPGMPASLRALVPLFGNSIMRIGTTNRTIEELEDLIKLKTGGVAASYFSGGSPHDIQGFSDGLSFSGYALDKNVPDMFEVLHTLLCETNFDSHQAEDMIRMLLQSDANGALDNVASSGHSYARRYAESGLTRLGLANEQTGGLTQLRDILSLSSRSEVEGLADVIAKLKTIQKIAISNSSNLKVALTCERESSQMNEKALRSFLSNFPRLIDTLQPEAAPSIHPRTTKSFFPLPYQVYYSALALPTVPYTHAASAPLQVLAQLLTHKHLHHEIREKGGAYGGGAYSRSLGGVFGFYSYRDPDPQNTMSIMESAGTWAVEKKWTERDMEEAKLSIFQGIDAPKSVNEQGMTLFLTGITAKQEQTMRERLLDVTVSDVKRVAEEFIVGGMEKARLTVLGEKKGWVESSKAWKIEALER